MRSRRTPDRRCPTVGILGLALCWAALPALAGNRNNGRLGVRLFETALELNYEIEDERQTSPFTDRDQRITTFRPRLDFRTEGWVYHPDLMLFSVGLTPERREEDTDVRRGGVDRDSTTSSLGYLLDLTFLRSRPYTLQLYASQSRNDFSTSLAPDSVTDSEIARAVLLLRNRFLLWPSMQSLRLLQVFA